MKNLAITFLSLSLLFTACQIPPVPSPVISHVLFYPQTAPLCSTGVVVEVSLSEFPKGYQVAPVFFKDGSDRGNEILPSGFEGRISFRLMTSATIPTRNDVVTNLPSRQTWQNFYAVSFMSLPSTSAVMRFQCSSDSPIEVVNVRPFDAVVVLEDSGKPSKLQLITYTRESFNP